MKFSTILMSFGFAAFTIAASTETTSSAATTVTLTPTQQCIAACDASDVNCQAGCVGVPSPDASAVNATNECAGKCVQGDGSPEATQKFSDCVQACISSNFLTTTKTGAPASTSSASTTGSGSGSSADNSGTNSGNSQPTGTGSQSSGSPTGTGSAASTSATGNAAPIIVTGGSFVGLFAIAAGILVL